MGADFEDDPLLGAAALVFQTPIRAKKAKAESSRGALRLSGAQIGRIARRRPEVMVKVTGSARGFRGLKEHLAYITRNGKLTGARSRAQSIARMPFCTSSVIGVYRAGGLKLTQSHRPRDLKRGRSGPLSMESRRPCQAHPGWRTDHDTR